MSIILAAALAAMHRVYLEEDMSEKIPIAELERLEKAATPGEWEDVFWDYDRVVIAVWRSDKAKRPREVGCMPADQAFIVAAHNEMPALLDWVKRAAEELRSRVDNCDLECSDIDTACLKCESVLKLLAELDLAQQQAGGSAEGV